ncbi:SMI1/KNR4 family protein [Niallia sp. XMNu-256]|uniref:SMI1/KNR4 family protein n=1 Tax=Niallia sp. XMNu-256 TaxID=3082444 RepID=UPI0030D5D928
MRSIDALKKRLVQNKLLVQLEDGHLEEVTFHFNPPASENELNKLPWYTPKDLEEFIKQHNGATIFNNTLFSVDEILKYMIIWDCPKFCIPIGLAWDGQWIACQYEVKTGENKMWLGEFFNFEEEFEKYPIDFSTWLDYLIVAQGSSYWLWLR